LEILPCVEFLRVGIRYRLLENFIYCANFQPVGIKLRMKAILLLITILLTGLGFGGQLLRAQTTSPDNVPPVGSTLVINPFNPVGVHAGGDGIDREYNFSYVQSLPLENLSWSQPDSLGKFFFPQASVATNYFNLYRKLYQNPGTQSPYVPKGFFETSYLSVDEEGLKILGNFNDFTYNTTANGDTFVFLKESAPYHLQSRLVLPFGMKYGDRLPVQEVQQDYWGGRIRGNRVDTFRVVRHVKTTIQCDGQGKLSTPSHYYPSVIRVRKDIEEVDSLYLNNGFFIEAYELRRINPTQYSWYVPNKPWEVVTMIYDGSEPNAIYGAFLIDTFKVTCNFGALRMNISENVGVVKVPVILTQPSETPVTVKINTYYPAPEAIPNVDFVPINNGSLTFEPGETYKLVEVAILDDSLIEDDKYFALGLETITPNAKIGTVNRYLFQILDDDVPVMYFSMTDTTIREDSAIVYMPLSISKPLTDSVEISMETLDRTAIADSDYVRFVSSVTLLPNQTKSFIPIQIINNDYNQGRRSFVLRIGRISRNVRIGISDTVRIWIQDDDFRPNVRFFTPEISTPEATNEPGNVFTIPIRISYPIAQPIRIHVKSYNESAKGDVNDAYSNGGDYVTIDQEVIAHPHDTIAYISVPINNDETVEHTETFILRIEGLSINAQDALEMMETRVIILDNDPFVSAPKPMVLEKVKMYPNPTQGTVRLTLPENVNLQNLIVTNGVGQSVKVSYETVAGNVLADFSGLANGIYTVQLITDQGNASQRVILQR